MRFVSAYNLPVVVMILAGFTSTCLSAAGGAELPSGKGAWPAIWLLGENWREIGWPRCGEIDIMEWTPETIDLFFNEQKYFSDPLSRFKQELAVSPFDRPMVLLINLAIGGSWGRTVDDNALPMTYKIDWVRVYHRNL